MKKKLQIELFDGIYRALPFLIEETKKGQHDGVEVRYYVPYQPINGQINHSTTTYDELLLRKGPAIVIGNSVDSSILEKLSEGIQFVINESTRGYICSEKVKRKLKRSTQHGPIIEESAYTTDVLPLRVPQTNLSSEESKGEQMLLMYLATPLITNNSTSEAYYSLFLLFFMPFTTVLPSSQEENSVFWEKILDEYLYKTKGILKKEQLEQDSDAYKKRTKTNNLIKVSLHSQLQKQGKDNQLTLLDVLEEEADDTRRKILENKIYDNRIEAVGIDLSLSQEKALFAVQKLLNATDYRGTEKNLTILDGKNPFLYSGGVPVIKFPTTEYLEAYGVTKFKSGRGKMEYSAAIRTEALAALRELADKRFLLCYTRKYWVETEKTHKEERFDVIRTITPLIQIIEGYEALTKSQTELVTRGEDSPETEEKLTMIAIEPNPILVDQIDTYFVLKPANYYQEIQLKFGKTSKYVYRFIDYLITEAAHRDRKKEQEGEPWIIQRNWHTLAQMLRMDAWIKSRQWKTIRGSLDKAYSIAKSLGYLMEYEVGVEGKTKEIDRLYLNPDKFRSVQEVEKRRKEIEQRT